MDRCDLVVRVSPSIRQETTATRFHCCRLLLAARPIWLDAL